MITTQPKNEKRDICYGNVNKEINNLNLCDEEDRNSLAGIPCDILANKETQSRKIFVILDSGARANLISYKTYKNLRNEEPR